MKTTACLALCVLSACAPCPAPNMPDTEPPEHHREHHGPGHHAHGPPAEGDQSEPLVHAFDEDSAEEWQARFEGPERDASQKPNDVIAAMQIATGMVIADLGTGTGYFLPYLSRAAGASGRVLAIDVAPNMIRHVKRRAAKEQLANVEPRLVLLDDPLLPHGGVDRILIVNTWHHIPERRQYVATLAKALRTGGSIWIIDFKKESPKGPPAEHKLEPAAVVAELSHAGLAARVDDALLPDQYIVIASTASGNGAQ